MSLIYEVKLKKWEATFLKEWKDRIAFYGPTPGHTFFASELTIRNAKELKIPFEIIQSVDPSHLMLPIIQSFPAILMDAPNQSAKEEALAYGLAQASGVRDRSLVYLGRDVDLHQDKEVFVVDIPGGRRRYAWKLIHQESYLPDFSIERSFSAMKEHMQNKDTKVVLALSGGGLKVFAHTTLLKFLNALGVYEEIDEIWGTSAGAIASLWYACGITPEKIQQNGYDLYNRLFSLKLSPSKIDVLKNLFINHCLPKRVRPSGFLGFINCTKSLTDFIVNVKQAAEPQKPFYCIAFNIQTSRTEVLTSEFVNPALYGNKIYKVDPIEAAVASSSVPVLFVPKAIRRNGQDIQYIDGGIEENTPMKSIYEKWLIDKKLGLENRKRLLIISSNVLNENRVDFFQNKHINEQDLIKITLNLLFQSVERNQRALLEQNPCVEMWDFQTPLSLYPMFDVKHIPLFIKLGYKEVATKALRIERKLQSDVILPARSA